VHTQSASIRRILLTVASAAVLTLVSACATEPAASPASAPASTVATTGTVGAVDFTNGYIELGTGATVVDSYFDFMCPYCQQFEAASGANLAELVDAGTITLRLHPMVFLDRLSVGTAYSTRSTNALIAVAALNPDATLPFVQLLFENKPEENAPGLTDDELVQYAAQATPADSTGIDITQAVRDRPYSAWAAATTQRATENGGVTGSDVTLVEHVPLTIVAGHSYTGDLSDSAAFAALVAAN
jgi:protein-disulfide isomerase